MPTSLWFPTRIYRSSIGARPGASLNPQLLREIRQLQRDDTAGVAWSAAHYPGGFTSYGSASRLHRISPTFARLERLIDAHVRSFARALDFDLRGRPLSMIDCWANVMPRGVVHGLHLHPLSTISGTYYVQVPRGASAIKFEDPRLDRMMAAPPRRTRARPSNRPWVRFEAQPGQLILFESWLRHEVPPNPARGQRISVSFNYGWF